MSATPLDLTAASPTSVKTEVDNALAALIGALNAVEMFAKFLPGGLGAEIAGGITVLNEIKALVDKFA